MYTNTLIHTMQKNKPSEKKIHTNRTLFSNLFFFSSFWLRTNQMWSKTDLFIQKHSKTEKKKISDPTRRHKNMLRRVQSEHEGGRRSRERERGKWRWRKRRIYTQNLYSAHKVTKIRNASNRRKVARCYYCFWCRAAVFSLIAHCSLRWNETKIVAKWFIMWNSVFCIRVCVCVRARVSLLFRFTFAFCGYESVRWSNVWNFLFLAFWYCCSFFLFFSRSLNGKGGKIEHIHSTRQARRSFWNFIILIVSFLLWVCVCAREFFFAFDSFPSSFFFQLLLL